MTASRKLSLESGAGINPEEIPARQGFSVSYMGKTLLSRIDPVAQAERLAAGLELKESTLYLCPSPLYGYGVPLILKKLKPNSALLCVEVDEKLFSLSQIAFSKNAIYENSESLPGSDDGNFALVRGTDGERLCAFVRERWGMRIFRRVEVIRLTGGSQLFPQLYDEFETALRREITVEWGNAMTLIRLGRLYARNLIRNLALASDGDAGNLNFGSSPVLVLGAGPSLDPLLDELQYHFGGKTCGKIPGPSERRYKIICVDTSLPALVEREILPDLVVVLESQYWNIRDFIGIQGREIDAALDLSSLPASTRVLGGKRYFYATPWTDLALFTRLKKEGLLPGSFAPLGSVGLTAVALALRLGSGPILTGGIDFSFTLDSFHARSTPGHRELLNRQNRFISIVKADTAFRDGTFSIVSKTGPEEPVFADACSKRVRSNPAMRNYRDLFEQEFGGNPRLLDIMGTGLPLGVKTVSVKDAIAILGEDTGTVRGEFYHEPRIFDSTLTNTNEKTEYKARVRDKIAAFISREMDTLTTLKDMLSGAIPAEPARLEALLDTADYLWAHFPECAGAGRRPPGTNISFLKRVRVEIEPFWKLWEMSLRDCQ